MPVEDESIAVARREGREREREIVIYFENIASRSLLRAAEKL